MEPGWRGTAPHHRRLVTTGTELKSPSPGSSNTARPHGLCPPPHSKNVAPTAELSGPGNRREIPPHSVGSAHSETRGQATEHHRSAHQTFRKASHSCPTPEKESTNESDLCPDDSGPTVPADCRTAGD